MPRIAKIIDKNLIISNIVVDTKSNCWNWQKYITKDGYPNISVSGKNYLITRLTYNLWNYTPTINWNDKTIIIKQSCGNKKCCNPLHLTPINKKANIIIKNIKSKEFFIILDKNKSRK